MVAGCGNKCVKYVFWLINFLFFVLGGIVVGFSIALRIDPGILSRLASSVRIDISRINLDTFYYILYGAIIIGAILFILGFLGCCGAACESLCVIGLYLIVVFILFGIEVAAIIAYFVKKDFLRDYFGQVFRQELISRYMSSQPMRELLDTMQNSWMCCGAYSCQDYANYGMAPPAVGGCIYCGNPQYQYQQIGCATKLWQVIDSNVVWVLIVFGIILLVELMSMIFSCVICGAVKEKRNQNY